MAHSLYRIQVPLTPEVRETMENLSRVMGKSLGATIADWLDDTKDAAQLAAHAMEQLRSNPARAFQEITGYAEQLRGDLAQAQAEAQAMVDKGATGAARSPARTGSGTGRVRGRR